MGKGSVDIGINWVSWLKQQADRYYVWDERAQYHRVLHPVPLRPVRPAHTLRDAWCRLPQQYEKFPNLPGNLFVCELKKLSIVSRAQIGAFFSAQGLRDFEFLGHGGRAIAYRALHVPTGQMRVVRMEAPHACRFPRPHHPAILQPFASNEGHMKPFGDIKLEVLPEVVPLSRLYRPLYEMPDSFMKEAFMDAVYDFARGTNMAYSVNMYDRDAKAQNVGLRADGRIVSFDPEVVTGTAAQRKHRYFKVPSILRDANAQQLSLVYPGYR